MSTSRTRIRRYLLLCFLAVGILLASGAIAGSADSHVTLTVEDSQQQSQQRQLILKEIATKSTR